MTLAQALRQVERLAHSDSAKVDLELLLMEVLSCSRTYLYTWPETELTPEQALRFESWVSRRAAGEPVAHILQKRGFWTLELEASPVTLIPRPETELLVEVALELLADMSVGLRVLDLGTGTGAIGLALASELPHSKVLATDLLPEVVGLAERNRIKHGISNCEVLQSDWWQKIAGTFDLIVSNPPYIEEGDPHLHSGDVRFEPRSALVAGEAGLEDLRRIIAGAPMHLVASGWLLLEHGWLQAEAVRRLLVEAGFVGVFSRRDYGGHERISGGQWFGDQ